MKKKTLVIFTAFFLFHLTFVLGQQKPGIKKANGQNPTTKTANISKPKQILKPYLNENLALYGFKDSISGKVAIEPKYSNVGAFSKGFAKVNIGGQFIEVDPDEENEEEGYSYFTGGKWGIINSTGIAVIPIKYDEIGNFNEGLAGVSLEGKVGFVNKIGQVVIPLKYSGATGFTNGVAVVELKDSVEMSKFGLINSKNITLTSIEFDNLNYADNGIYVVEKSGLYGLIDRSGKIIIPCKYDFIDYSEGYAIITVAGKMGLLDKNGKEVYSPINKHIYRFDDDGFSLIIVDDNKSFYFHKSGLKLDSKMEFKDGLAKVSLNDKYGMIDKDAHIIIPLKFDRIGYFNQGLASVMINNKYGFVDKTGKEIITPAFDWVSDFVEGYAQFKLDGKYGYIDKTGKIVVPPTFDELYVTSKGLTMVKLNNKFGFVDWAGKVVIPIKYEYAASFKGDTTYVNVGRTYDNFKNIVVRGKWGLIDLTGKEIIPIKYDNIYGNAGGITYIKLDSLKGIFDVKKGIEVLSPKYNTIWSFHKGMAEVELNGKHGYIDSTMQEVIPLKYASIWDFEDGLALVNVGGTIANKNVIGGKYGFIDKKGKEVIPAKYDVAWPFKKWYTEVTLDKKKYLIDKHDKLYTTIQVYKNNYYKVFNGEKYGIVDASGTEIVPTIYDVIEESPEFFVKAKANRKFGFVDVTVKVVIKIKYDDITPVWFGSLIKRKYYKVSDGGKFGITDTLGVEIIPPIYDAIEKSTDFFAKVKTNGKFGFIDAIGKVVIEIKYDEIGPFNYGSAVVVINNEGSLIDLSGKEVINPEKVKNYFKYNYTTICDAIYDNDFKKVKLYAKYVDLNLMYKKQASDYFPVELLIDKIAYSKFNKDYELLHRKEILEIIHLFLDQGMNVDLDIGHKEGINVDLNDRAGFRGTTMLLRVIDMEYSDKQNFKIGDRLKLVELLIEHKANVNSIISSHYKSPLFSLCGTGHLDEDASIAQLLIDNGADISIEGDKGQTLIKKAKESGATKELIEVLEKAKRVYKKK